MDDYLDELDSDVERIISRMNTSAHDLVLIGAEMERIIIFSKYRKLMNDKELAGDRIAVEVLSWAYDQLGESLS